MSGLTEEWFAELRRATSAVISASSSGSYEEFYRARDNFRAAMNWNAAHVLLNEIERLQRELDDMTRQRDHNGALYERACERAGNLELERETLAAAVMADSRLVNILARVMAGQATADDVWRVLHQTTETRKAALALLDGQKDEYTTTYRQMDEFADGWECTAPDCDTAWTLPDGGPSHHRMRFCPGCGRRIVGEEPWRVEEDGGGV